LDVPRSHRYFRGAHTDQIGVADRSGATPDRTEDGVLWLDRSRPIVLDNREWLATIPLIYPDGTTTRTGDTLGGALRVARMFAMHVEPADGAGEAIRILCNAINRGDAA
jgi:hypothetical protein